VLVPLDVVVVLVVLVATVAVVVFQLALAFHWILDSLQSLLKEVKLLHDTPESFEKQCFSSAHYSLGLMKSAITPLVVGR